jgi:TolB protein
MYKRIIKILLTASLVMFVVSCKEETVQPELYGTLTGVIYDAETNQPIEGASVTTAPATGAVLTDSLGRYTYPNILVSNYSVTAAKPNYVKTSVSVVVRENQTTTADIYLQRTPPGDLPGTPINPSPSDGAVDIPVNVTLAWSKALADSFFKVAFDVYFYDAFTQIPERIAKDITDTTVSVKGLKYNLTYFWQVVAKINDTLITNGNTWSFTTRNFPDNRFLFTTNRDGNYEIYTTDSTEYNTVRLTFNGSKDLWPRMSPNRVKIAFTSDASQGSHIYTMNRDGSGLYKVTNIPVAGFNNYGIGFSWSVDGGYFIYSHYDRLYRIDQFGANLTLIATAPAGRHFREVEYSPFGDKIVALTVGQNPFDNEIYIMNSDGSNMTLFVPNLPGVVESPSFSIDGLSIMYTWDVSGFQDPTGRQLDSRIFIQRIDGSDTTEVSFRKPAGTNDINPRFSPDGSKIICTNFVNDGVTPKEIWLIDLSAADRKRVSLNAEMPDWK